MIAAVIVSAVMLIIFAGRIVGAILRAMIRLVEWAAGWLLDHYGTKKVYYARNVLRESRAFNSFDYRN